MMMAIVMAMTMNIETECFKSDSFAAVIQRFTAKLGESLSSVDTAGVVAVSLKYVELSEAKT